MIERVMYLSITAFAVMGIVFTMMNGSPVLVEHTEHEHVYPVKVLTQTIDPSPLYAYDADPMIWRDRAEVLQDLFIEAMDRRFVFDPSRVFSNSRVNKKDFMNLFDAIRFVETGGEVDPTQAIGAAGEVGPYQITENYYIDSDVGGDYSQVTEYAFAEYVMMSYWMKYCPDAVANKDWEVLARCHNGGPKGHLKDTTVSYWKRVKKKL
jgi:hypothetical protein